MPFFNTLLLLVATPALATRALEDYNTNFLLSDRGDDCDVGYTIVTNRTLCCETAKADLNFNFYYGGCLPYESWSGSYLPYGCLYNGRGSFSAGYVYFNDVPGSTGTDPSYGKVCIAEASPTASPTAAPTASPTAAPTASSTDVPDIIRDAAREDSIAD